MSAQQAAEVAGLPTLVGPYTGAAVFHDEARGLTPLQIEKMGGTDGKAWLFTGYAPTRHTDKDFCLCAILNLNGRGWMVYPEHKVAVEFYDGSTWLFESRKPHCCSPALGSGRVGVGLYSAVALGARGSMAEPKVPSESKLEWTSRNSLSVSQV